MKTIGLLGGMSWESTVTYYTNINRMINHQLGGLHSAKLLLASVDFAEIEAYQKENEWEKSAVVLTKAAQKLEKSGADFLLICTNTMHKNYHYIQNNLSIPVLHIADATIAELQNKNISHIGLIGTSYTMEQDFYKKRIVDSGIQVTIPEQDEIAKVNDIIFKELVFGKTLAESKSFYLEVIEKMVRKGAQGIILGCTEIDLLIQQEDLTIPVFDTTIIHSEKAVNEALKEVSTCSYNT